MHNVTPELLDFLLGNVQGLLLPEHSQWRTHEGLNILLAEAAKLMGRDPRRARLLAMLVEDFSGRLGNSPLTYQAQYLRAQTHAIDAEFDQALGLIDQAYQGFSELGEISQAARTNVGKMMVLQQLGRFAETLATGESVLMRMQALHTAESDDAMALVARVFHNMGVCHTQMGHYSAALEAYDQATVRYLHLQMHTNIGDLNNDRAVALLYLGRADEALQCCETALTKYDKSLTLKRSQTLGNMGNAQLLAGNHTEALRTFELVRTLLDPLPTQTHKTTLLLDLADAYLSLNLYEEALAEFQRVEIQASESGMTQEHARAMWGIGAALIALKRGHEAQAYLRFSAGVFERSGNAPMLATILLKQALLRHEQHDVVAACDLATRALATVPIGQWPYQHALARLTLAQLVMPDYSVAMRHLDACEPLLDQLGMPNLRYLYHLRRGLALRLMGVIDEAKLHLILACDLTNSMQSGLNTDQLRVAFSADKTAAHDALLQLYLHRNQPGDAKLAWQTAEKSKARSLLESLGANGNTAGDFGESADKQALRAMQSQLNLLYSSLLHGSGNNGSQQGDADLLQNTNKRALDLEREINRLTLRIGTARPGNAKTSETIDLEELQSLLGPTTACISYHSSGDQLYAFVVRRTSIVIVGAESEVPAPLCSLSRLETLLNQFAQHLDRFRAGTTFVVRHMAQLESATINVLAKLYDLVFRKLEPNLAGCDQLYVIPHARLHQLPFQALHDGSAYLIDRFVISYAPSATVFALCLARKVTTSQRAVVVGVSDELIPEAEKEAHAVAQQLGTDTRLLTEGTTVDGVVQAVAGASLLHIACHGLFRAGNPMFSSLKLHFGWLLATDVRRMSLKNATVTLSACESGRTTAVAGDEVLGLTRAFLAAGAKTIVVSMWVMADSIGVLFMHTFYREIASQSSKVEALRRAQLVIRNTHSHPFYWAAFVLLGDPV